MAASEENTNDSLIAIGKLLGKLTTKSVPTWDIGENEPIKNHIRRFENAVGGATDMDDTEIAREFVGTLRGSAAVFVEELAEDVKTNYPKLKDELLSTFQKEKSVNAMIRDFNSLKWRKDKQTIREFAAILNIQWRKIAGAAKDEQKKDDKCSQAILKNRLFDAIKEADPKFGSSLQFFLNDSALNFKDLAAHAELKFDSYKENLERIQELGLESDPMFFNSEIQNKMRRNRNFRHSRKNRYNGDIDCHEHFTRESNNPYDEFQYSGFDNFNYFSSNKMDPEEFPHRWSTQTVNNQDNVSGRHERIRETDEISERPLQYSDNWSPERSHNELPNSNAHVYQRQENLIDYDNGTNHKNLFGADNRKIVNYNPYSGPNGFDHTAENKYGPTTNFDPYSEPTYESETENEYEQTNNYDSHSENGWNSDISNNLNSENESSENGEYL